MLDTGSPFLVLNLTYFRDYPLIEAEEERHGASGAEFNAAKTEVKQFSFGSMNFPRMKADLANLGNIENTKGVKILGLIGMELLRSFEMIIDYESSQIHFHRIGRNEAKTYKNRMLADPASYTEIPFELTDSRIMLKGELAGKKLRLIIDSGAETNMLDTRLPSTVFQNITITGRTQMSGAGTKKIEVLRGNLQSLTVGGQRFETLPVIIANLEKTCFAHGGCVDGILGFDFLSLKKIGFNFVTGKLYIWK